MFFLHSVLFVLLSLPHHWSILLLGSPSLPTCPSHSTPPPCFSFVELPLPAEEPEALSLVSVRGADDICSTEASAEVASSVVFVGLGEQEGWDRGKKDRGTEDRREDQGRKEDEGCHHNCPIGMVSH